MKLCVVGTGYVGLVSGACYAESGQTVTCVDVDAAKIAALQAGRVPMHEPGLEELVQRSCKAGRLAFSTEVAAAVAAADVVCVAVGTPPHADGSVDLRMVDAVAATLRQHAQSDTIVLLKSTVPVGTNARVRHLLAGSGSRIAVVSNPEFLKEGDAVRDFMRPERIVIGCDPDPQLQRRLSDLYHPFCLSHDRILWMDPASAELCKYTANTMLALRIAFMNEIASLCEAVGADVQQVRRAVGSDSRIGPRFLHAGPGYGGSCLPKDVRALVRTAHAHGIELQLAAAAEQANEHQKGVLLRKLQLLLDGQLRGRRIGLWGLTFKPETDDLRESPALVLIESLLDEGAEVVAHDPAGLDNARRLFETRQLGDGRLHFAEEALAAAEGADALVLVTEWRQYQHPDFAALRACMRRPVLLDGRNVWSHYDLRARGFVYQGIGTQCETSS